MMFHIEFVGLPGSGKSTLYRALDKKIRMLNNNLKSAEQALFDVFKDLRTDRKYPRYLRVIPDFLLERKINTIFKCSEYRFHAQNRYFAEKGSTFDAFLRSSAFDRMGTDEREKVISWFLNFAAKYQFVEDELRSDIGVVFDEGFMQKSMSLFTSPNVAHPPKRELFGYLNTVPLPDLLIWVITDNERCISRILSRGQGKSLRIHDRDPDAIRSYLCAVEAHFTRLMEWLANRRTVVVSIDNDRGLDEVVDELTTGILNALSRPSVAYNREVVSRGAGT